MNSNDTSHGLILRGLDGGNPLAFLAAIGTAATATRIWPDTRMHWQFLLNSWHPVLIGCEPDEEAFLMLLCSALRAAPLTPFTIDDKLPFPVENFIAALKTAVDKADAENRRECDFLAGFGTEMYPEPDSKKMMMFRDTRLRMVRSGDSAGQGFPAYARAIRQATETVHLRRTLFVPWDYQDCGSSFRWDPLEDQRYALRWRDPSKSGVKDGPGMMIGANSLAIEALSYLPTMIMGGQVETTGFHRSKNKRTYFSWPIWIFDIGLDTVRSLLALSILQNETVLREELGSMGIVEIFRSQRIQQNQYYSNFAPAVPA